MFKLLNMVNGAGGSRPLGVVCWEARGPETRQSDFRAGFGGSVWGAGVVRGLGRGEGELSEERSCTGCDLCCTVLRVDELDKLGGVPCVHLRRAEPRESWGCGIHTSRPNICRAYRCLWLRGGLGDDDRPDRLGAVLDVVPEGASPYLAIRELRAGTFDGSPRLREIAEEFRATMSVRITSADEVLDPDRPYRVLQADGCEQRIAGEWVASFQHGEPVSHRRMPWLERTVRRLQLAAVSIKLRRQARRRARRESGESKGAGCP